MALIFYLDKITSPIMEELYAEHRNNSLIVERLPIREKTQVGILKYRSSIFFGVFYRLYNGGDKYV